MDYKTGVFIISSIRIWLQKSNMELMCLGTTIHVFYATKMGKKIRKEILYLFPKIRTFGDTTCSMKNCFAVIVQSG